MSREFTGFDQPLTNNETKLLQCFKVHKSVTCPVDIGFDMETTYQILQDLKKKQVLKGEGPFQLTQKGKRILGL